MFGLKHPPSPNMRGALSTPDPYMWRLRPPTAGETLGFARLTDSEWKKARPIVEPFMAYRTLP
jgi:hypothetical protein